MAEVEQTTYRRYRFNVKQYYALAEAGILAPDEHVELLDGRITNKWPVPGQPCPPDDFQDRLFTVDEYYAMAEAGILAPDERVELLDGRIYIMSPIGSPHAACVDHLNELLMLHLAGKATIRIQNPIHLAERTEPEPDVALLKRRSDFYAHAHPTPADVLLAIEVADTTLATDRAIKLPLYARHGINTTWIVNLPDSCVEIYSEPAPEGYRRSERRRRGQTLDVPAFPDLSLSVDDVLVHSGRSLHEVSDA